MNDEINRMNQTLSTAAAWQKIGEYDGKDILSRSTDERRKTDKIRQWMESVIHHLDHYKDEHHKLLKEAATLLELALWKTNLVGKKEGKGKGVRAAGEVENSRDEIRYTSGASIVIKNVLPFLALKL